MTALHADRGGTSGVHLKAGVVVHDSEGGEGGNAAANLVAYLSRPGDRPNGSGGMYGSGYHAVADELGGYIQIGDWIRNPYHAPPLNATWWSICMPGKAGQTREQWLDGPSRQYIRGVAQFIVDRWHEDGERWPLEFRTATELLVGGMGYTSHNEVSQAWHRTDHWDPGPHFPWDVLATDIAALVNEHPVVIDPQPEPGDDNMAKRTLFIPTDCDAQFLGWADDAGNAIELTWVTKAVADAHRGVGVVIRDQLSLGGFGNCVLLGPVPVGDTRHNWTGAEFFRVVA